MNEDYKSQAARLGAHLAAKHGIKLKNSNLLEAIAAVHSARDWNTLHARAGSQTDAPHPSSSVRQGLITFADGDDGRAWLVERMHRAEAEYFHLVPGATDWKLLERKPSGERVHLASLGCPQATRLGEYFLNQAGLPSLSTEPMTGQFISTLSGGDARHELRYSVATLPTVHGQSLVLRAHRSYPVLSVRDLGLSAGEAWLDGVAHGPRITVVAGITGVGKTTTLKATARALGRMGRTVCLISEDVEELGDVFVMGVYPIVTSKGATKQSLSRTLEAVERLTPDHIIIDDERLDPQAAIQVAALVQKGFRVTLSLNASSGVNVVRRLVEFGLNPRALHQPLGALCQNMLLAAPAAHTESPGRRVASNFSIMAPHMEPHLDECGPTDTVADAIRLLEVGAVSMSSFVRCYGNYGVGQLPEHLGTGAQ